MVYVDIVNILGGNLHTVMRKTVAVLSDMKESELQINVYKSKYIISRIPTVKTARTLRLCCVFRYYMEYSATWDVLMLQVMYKL